MDKVWAIAFVAMALCMLWALRELRIGAEANLKAWEHARWLWERLVDEIDRTKEPRP